MILGRSGGYFAEHCSLLGIFANRAFPALVQRDFLMQQMGLDGVFYLFAFLFLVWSAHADGIK